MGNDAKQTLLIYGVGYRSYNNWIKRGKPEYKRQCHINAKEAVESIYSRKHGIFGAEKTRLKILKDFNIKLSRETIIELRTEVLLKLKKEIASAKSKTRIGINTHKKHTSLDLIKEDYSSNKYLEKIGIDRTWFKNIYIRGVKTKRLFLPAYDFYSNEISSYSVANSENILVSLEMLEGLVRKMNLVRITRIIMHSDLGSSFTSKETEKFCKQHNIIRSNSASGFKGNQFVEQTHRWVKKHFYLIFGNKFTNDQHFRSCIYKFVKIFNSTNIILKNGCTPNEIIQNFRK
ncbi:hypothetical protein [Spiroplasma endosymbiont of Cantharis rufa]|uniref:hypothetical protein n=1 Tax=Spiroplasma endosymbiont of Cantharis rufa TaxID=3066279 RepID=UPI0030CE3E9E